MTNATTTTEWVEAKNLTVGDMTDHGPITGLIVSWDGVIITTEGTNPKTGGTFQTRWGQAPTHFVRVTR